MRRSIVLQRMFLLIASAGILAACSLRTDLLPTAPPTPTTTPETGWQYIADGLEWKTLRPKGDDLAQLIVVRINPAHYTFRARYRARDPQSLSNWRELESGASVVINANFFDINREVLGLVVSDGAAHGGAYRDRGGTFLLRNDIPTVLANRSQVLPSDGSIQQAVQGFPLLIEDGRQVYFFTANAERTRRTLIAEDQRGNILIMVSPFLGLSLADLGAYLPSTDLDIETAFNLDGGGSTMIALPGADYYQPSFDPVPTILAVYAR